MAGGDDDGGSGRYHKVDDTHTGYKFLVAAHFCPLLFPCSTNHSEIALGVLLDSPFKEL